ncbi:adenine-specific DNA methyltransferase [Sulfolobales archaeon HS-7]|nr:adenine-specific DNA methyltransferase [Sulfolobales archaeon HS-7]
MPHSNEDFFSKLTEIFVGEKVEGNDPLIRLMRMKREYFLNAIQEIRNYADSNLKRELREEVFSKLYTFFFKYFCETGTVFLCNTDSYSVYDRIYAFGEDVALFWKTRGLYYIKSERVLKSMKVILDETSNPVEFEFKVNSSKGGKLRYRICGVRENVVEICVNSSDEEINSSEALLNVNQDLIKRAIKTFERQSNIDYFLAKDPRGFLEEQLKIWIYQYLLDSRTVLDKSRIEELEVLLHVAEKVIDVVANFEEELVKMWNKPRFVLKSNYVVTINKILRKEGGKRVLEKILTHGNFPLQVKEWLELGFISHTAQEIANEIRDGNYLTLPIDTKYFKDVEEDIISLFNIDSELDGWLIKSENYQALNTLRQKFQRRVQTIYIDPPFNKEQEADYFYSVKYKDSTWITMLENRLVLAKEILRDDGGIFIRCDYNGNAYVRMLGDEIFGKDNFRNEIVISRTKEFYKSARNIKRFMVDTDTLFYWSKTNAPKFRELSIPRMGKWWEPFLPGKPKDEEDEFRVVLGSRMRCPHGRKWGLTQEQINYLERERRLKVVGDKVYYYPSDTVVKNNWTDIPGYSRRWGFETENSESLLKRVILSTTDEGDIIMDFFLGSGTTTAVAQKLRRRWIGIEMGDHFYSVVLPRMKKVLFFDSSGISSDEDIKRFYNRGKTEGFFKYYELEQFEDILRSSIYLNHTSGKFFKYEFLRDPKLLSLVEMGKDKVKLKLEELNNVDLPETLSLVTGKWIRSIIGTKIDFIDGSTIDVNELDFQIMRRLIWW